MRIAVGGQTDAATDHHTLFEALASCNNIIFISIESHKKLLNAEEGNQKNITNTIRYNLLFLHLCQNSLELFYKMKEIVRKTHKNFLALYD